MHRRGRTLGALIGAVAVLWLAAGPSAGSAHGALIKTGPVSFAPSAPGGCASADLRATVRVSNLVGGRGVLVTASVRNHGATACPYEGSPGPVQALGPCGVMTIEVLNAHNRDVWPGDIAYMCPLLIAERLAPGALIVATGRWNGTLAAGDLAPSGRYQLVVGGHLSFRITLG